jgi:hypothetical protein
VTARTTAAEIRMEPWKGDQPTLDPQRVTISGRAAQA